MSKILIMDDNVIAAMARWPNVPDVYGWLSLTVGGLWRLHPRGDAWHIPRDAAAMDSPVDETGTAGESISSPQIIRFINRNYNHDDRGRWFFQNGPQRVYVRLDAAPYIVRTNIKADDNAISFHTHTGLEIVSIQEWCLDDGGRLYARTEHGPGLIAGRDLPAVLEALYTTEGVSLLDALEADPSSADGLSVHASGAAAVSAPVVPLRTCPATDIPARLGFVAHPHPEK